MTNYVNSKIKELAGNLLNHIMYDLGWENSIFFPFEGAEHPKAVLIKGDYVSQLALPCYNPNKEGSYEVSQALVAYELLEQKIVEGVKGNFKVREDVRKLALTKEYQSYLKIKALLNVPDIESRDKVVQGYEVPPVGESVNNLVEGIKTRSLALLALDILQELSKQYPWVENAKFEYTGGYVTCVLWRDGVRYTKMAEDNGDSALTAVLLYKTVRCIVGEDIESCVRASSAYNHIIRLWSENTDQDTTNSEYTTKHQLRDAHRLYDILLHDLGTYFYTRVFCNHDKKAVTAITTRGSKNFVGVAKTHVDDTYHPVVGKAVALYKAFQEELKDYALNGVTGFTYETQQYMREAEKLYEKITTV